MWSLGTLARTYARYPETPAPRRESAAASLPHTFTNTRPAVYGIPHPVPDQQLLVTLLERHAAELPIQRAVCPRRALPAIVPEPSAPALDQQAAQVRID